MRVFSRTAWLSLTPEPERELPGAVAALRAGGAPPAALVAKERARVERLIARGSRRRWMRWLGEAGELAERVPSEPGGPVMHARSVTLDVIGNHHALMLGLPGRFDAAAELTRRRLALLRPESPAAGPSR